VNKPENMSNQELANELEMASKRQPLYNFTAQLYDVASKRVKQLDALRNIRNNARS
jgi:hypothetical protein